MRVNKTLLSAALVASALVGVLLLARQQGWAGSAATDFAYVRGDIVAIGARVAGYAVEVPVDDNRTVHAGDLLLRIDPRDYQAAADRADRALLQAVAQQAQVVARQAVQQSRIAASVAAREAVQAQAGVAQSNYQRTADLVETGFLSPARFDDARAAQDASRAQIAQSEAALSAEQRQLVLLDAEIAAAEARVAEARATLQTARLALGDTEIRAPVDGTVANRRVRAGEYVAVGARLMSVVPQAGFWIEANFRETQLRDLAPGAAVRVSLDSAPQQLLCGHIDSVGPASGSEFALLPADNATGNFTKIVRRVPVRVRVDAPPGLLKPGLSAQVQRVEKC